MMWNFLNQAGPATGSLDFTNDLSLLLVGLLSVVWLSSGMIVWLALSHALLRKPKAVETLASTAEEQQDAA